MILKQSCEEGCLSDLTKVTMLIKGRTKTRIQKVRFLHLLSMFHKDQKGRRERDGLNFKSNPKFRE